MSVFQALAGVRVQKQPGLAEGAEPGVVLGLGRGPTAPQHPFLGPAPNVRLLWPARTADL